MNKLFDERDTNLTQCVINAEPGYFALDRICYDASDRIEIQQIPVIAWRIIYDPKHEWEIYKPICVDNLSDLFNDEILAPDGKVYRAGCKHWNNLDDFTKEITARKAPNANRVQTTIMDRMIELNKSEVIKV